MKKSKQFHPTAVRKAVAVLATLTAAASVHAGPGFGDAYNKNKVPFIIGTYFANSPAGQRLWVPMLDAAGNPVLDAAGKPKLAPQAYDPANQASYDAAVKALYPAGYPGTGKALRKFVDPLPLPEGHALTQLAGNAPQLSDISQGVVAKYLPVAKPVKWVNPQGVVTGDDYYEIASVEYSEKFHSDLKKATTLRGYVQIDPFATYGWTAPAGWTSKAVPLTYPDGKPILVAAVDAKGKLIPGAAKVQAKAVDNPHYLGPVIQATRHVPTRVKFLNLLPVGRAETMAGFRKEWNGSAWVDVANKDIKLDATGRPLRHGDIFLPLDPSIAGSGVGPDGITEYTQNRVNIHLHGGDNPWISDGTPHQWITPAGELDANDPLSMIATLGGTAADPTLVDEYTRGPGAKNVPDMNDPGPGAMTYYFPNGQTPRMEWYHDHTYGVTRLNVYAGLASAYLLTDASEQAMVGTSLPGADATIPLILQDKTFVPDDIALQDARWNTRAWGEPGDMWFPHVYETVQDPNQDTNFNAVGRWHWGPWFWPSFPSANQLPSGAFGDVSTTPEAWMDTPVVNGVAYPTLTVEPKPYRLRILNASNDRSFTFNLFVATDKLADGSTNPLGATEVSMIPVGSRAVCADPNSTRTDASGCVPANWAQDIYGHNGGVPDPATQGPTLMQIASEGGWLPGVASKDPAPISYLLDKGRAAVLNVDWGTSGLHLGNGERADVVVDFSAYCGKTLIVYNDSGAPVPAADPRNEYFTGYGDNSNTGGAEDTLPGYGPNSRTMMQIKVAACGSPITGSNVTAAADPALLDPAIKAAYKGVQETPVVAQSAYNAALQPNPLWTDDKAFANIYTGSLKQPTFDFVPGSPEVFNSVNVVDAGSGYLTPPVVSLSAPQTAGGVQATATSSLKIDKLHVISGGAGYRVAPTLTITSLGKGSGAAASSRLKVSNVHVTSGGSGYAAGGLSGVAVNNGGRYAPGLASVPVTNGAGTTGNAYAAGTTFRVAISAPAAGGVQATAVVRTGSVRIGRVNYLQVQGITITNPGSGYVTPPTVSVSVVTGTAVRAATLGTPTTAIVAPTVTFPAPAGGLAATGTVVFDAVNGVVTGVTLNSNGSGYSQANPPIPQFNGGSVVTAASATTTVGAGTTAIFAKPTGTDGAGNPGRQATGTAVVDATGAIIGVAITDGGSGYTSMPSVTFSRPAGTTGANAVATTYGSVSELVLDVPDPTNPSSSGGGGYDNLLTAAADPAGIAGLTITFQTQPAVVPAAAGFASAIATAGATGKVFDITLGNHGTGYAASTPTAPSATVTVAAPGPLPTALAAATTWPQAVPVQGTAAIDTANGGAATGKYLVKTKAIQELFDPTYGRLNATFGVEIPYTSALTQTTIPLGYVDPVTEEFADGETQIWKITHNGVDTHPIHFHLLNVQLVNRVGWDNFVTPPEANELGWKEVIKMSPLEDVIVAVRAKKPTIRTASADGTFRQGAGFGLPLSIRRRDPSQPDGAMSGFTQIDPNTGLPAPVANEVNNYGWEYVWHCHILGHEENDFMRPIKFNANEVTPLAPTSVALDSSRTLLTWNDVSDTETAYRVERATSTTGVFTPVAAETQLLPANSTQATVVAQTGDVRYRVTAVGNAGGTLSVADGFNGEASTVLVVAAPPAAPSGVSAVSAGATSVTLTWTDNATNESGWSVQRATVTGGVTGAFANVGVAAPAGTAGTGSVTLTDTGLTTGTTYVYRVAAQNAGGLSAYVQSGQVTPTAPAVNLPGNVLNLQNGSDAAGTNGNNNGNNTASSSTNLSWTAPNVTATRGAATSYLIESCSYTRVSPASTCTNFTTVGTTSNLVYPVTMNGAVNTTRYIFRVTAVNGGGTSAQSRTITVNP
ncbi:fibronectin type III domain-containing protein [Leptothrix sp. BB-4]